MRFDLEALSLPVPAGPGAGVQPDVQPSGPLAEGGRSDGQPLLLAIDTVDEDPDQPRREVDLQALEELAATIAEFGVRQPVSVRAHPDVPGRWLLNFGCRRLRASRLAGRTEIPAFVDAAADSYVKVIENEQRSVDTAGGGDVHPATPRTGREPGRHRPAAGQGPCLREPRWFKDALAAGKSLEELGGQVNSAPADSVLGTQQIPAKKVRPVAKKAEPVVKFKDDAGHTWSGMGPKPKWLKDALDAGKPLEELTA